MLHPQGVQKQETNKQDGQCTEYIATMNKMYIAQMLETDDDTAIHICNLHLQ